MSDVKPWHAANLSYAEAAELMRRAGHDSSAYLADAAEKEWFEGEGSEAEREQRAEKIFRLAIALAEDF